jgi:hypothetical protein
MLMRSTGIRVLLGLAVLAVVLVFGFSLVRSRIHTWGSTAEEVARRLPGDELLDRPALVWTHGISIRQVPEMVWPWIAQLGDDRGGFYSYTFIENLIARERLYRNADRIIPELQDPQPGTGMIADFLRVRGVASGRYLLADSTIPELGWTWIWALFASGSGETRLVVRSRIQPRLAAPPALAAVAGFLVDVGGFVMERRMMQGIKDRAEGRVDPPYLQGLEIALWLAALALGVTAAVLYLARRQWWRGLGVGLAAVALLFFLTFGQPAIWVRMLLLLALAVGVAWASGAERLPARRR